MSEKTEVSSSSKMAMQASTGQLLSTNNEDGGSLKPEIVRSVSKDDKHDSSPEQVMYFTSESELSEYVQTLNLHRVMISDLQYQNDLTDCYIGGQVISQLDFSSSQSDTTHIFIQDDSVSENSSNLKNLLVEIDVGIIRAYNIPPLIKDHKLYIHKATITNDVIEMSQDIGKKIVVIGSEPRVWVVHKHAHTDKFFQTTCGKIFWKKRKKYLARKKAEEEKKQASVPSVPTGTVSGVVQTRVEQEQALEITFPDVPDFPDSAFEGNDDINTDGSLLSSPPPSTDSSSSDSESDSDNLSDMEWVPKRRKTGKTGKYMYTTLADLQPTGEKVNVFGVVKEFSSIGPTMGSDYSCSLTLVDETDPQVGVKCILFNSKELLPHVRKPGDILCIHRAFVKEYQYSPQLNGRRFTSVLRFSGDIHRKIRPETGCETYTFVREDRLRVKELRLWAVKKKRKENACKLNSVNPDVRFNLLCQVVSVCALESLSWCTVLTVWDGTMLPLKARRVVDKDFVQTGFSATAHGLEEQVFVYDKKCLKHQNVRPGSVVFLYGVHAAVYSGESEFQIELSMGNRIPGSLRLQPGEIELLSSNDYSFSELQLQLEKTASESLAVTTCLGSLTKEPFFTLEEIQSRSLKDNESLKFRCRVKLVGVVAPSLEGIVRLRCTQCDRFEPVTRDMDIDENGVANEACKVCVEYGQNLSDFPKPSCMYYFELLLSDHTDTVNAHVAHPAAMDLFNGILPTNFYQHKQARLKVNKVFSRLTGGNPFFNTRVMKCPRPWLDGCIAKFQKSKGDDVLCLCETVLTSDT